MASVSRDRFVADTWVDSDDPSGDDIDRGVQKKTGSSLAENVEVLTAEERSRCQLGKHACRLQAEVEVEPSDSDDSEGSTTKVETQCLLSEHAQCPELVAALANSIASVVDVSLGRV